MRSSLQTIFREHFASYAQGRDLHAREWRAANSIRDCRSAALGGQVLSCESGHYSRIQYNACRHRSCPTCADRPRQQWLQQQLQRLLPCDHFHGIFTLPHDFIPLWSFNRTAINSLLFDCARESLLELCADQRFLGAKPGLLMALHSWGRTLSQHPHVHCLITAGGLNQQGQWVTSRPDYLLPVKALSALYRGKLLHHLKQALRAQRLHLPPQQDREHWMQRIKAQYRKHWNVEISEPYRHGRGVALYLARYVKGGPLSRDRALNVYDQSVEFGYTDHRDGQAKQLRLSTHEFIARILWHAPPRGQHMVRHCGLYATAAHVQRQRSTQMLRPVAPARIEPALARHDFSDPPMPSCPHCQATLKKTLSLLPAHRSGEFSIRHRPLAAEPLGPTQRSSGGPVATSNQALRRRSLRHRTPLN